MLIFLADLELPSAAWQWEEEWIMHVSSQTDKEVCSLIVLKV